MPYTLSPGAIERRLLRNWVHDIILIKTRAGESIIGERRNLVRKLRQLVQRVIELALAERLRASRRPLLYHATSRALGFFLAMVSSLSAA